MSMIFDYHAFTPEEWEKMQTQHPSEVMELLMEEVHLSIEKSWHVLHWLLTGDSGLDDDAFTQPPLGNVVMGGTESIFEAGYGFVRYLTPKEVEAVADALTNLPFATLSPKFDAEAFNDAKLYPLGLAGGWKDDEVEMERDTLETIYYPELVEFFHQAAERGDIVLLSLN